METPTRVVAFVGSHRRSGTMRRRSVMRVLSVIAVVLFAMQLPSAQERLTLVRSIELPHVEGRIVHLAFDATSQRLFVAALGNNTAEVPDGKAGTHMKRARGCHEPQGSAGA